MFFTLPGARRALGLLLPLVLATMPQLAADPFRREFKVAASDLSASGRSRWFVLEPGHQTTLANGTDRLVITVLPETRVIDGVETRVVEERETHAGALVEVSRNFFAISRRNGDVYYFGEDVDIYKNGKIVSHDGAWQSGMRGAKFGMLVEGAPAVGVRHYQEIAPRVAMDRVRVMSMSERRTVNGITYTNVMKVEETTPLEPGQKEYKWYAPDIGLIVDGNLELVSAVSPSPRP